MCGFLVDVYCLGVKNLTGPEIMGAGSFPAYARTYYSAFDHPPLSIGVEQAQAIVHGAIAYAHDLGFAPASGFEEAAAHLGTPPTDCRRSGTARTASRSTSPAPGTTPGPSSNSSNEPVARTTSTTSPICDPKARSTLKATS